LKADTHRGAGFIGAPHFFTIFKKIFKKSLIPNAKIIDGEALLYYYQSKFNVFIFKKIHKLAADSDIKILIAA
jgi:hypothetical protein